MISYFNRWDQQVINRIGWRTCYHKSRVEPNLPRQPFAQIYHELTGNPHRNRRGNPCLRRGQRGPRSIAEGGGLLVAVLEGGGRRLVAGEVGDEGVEAVDRHFLRGHHHPTDRRWSLPRRATSSPARAGGQRRGRRPPRESGGGVGEEEVGRRKQAMRLFLLSLKSPLAWAFCLSGVPFSMDDFAPGSVGTGRHSPCCSYYCWK